MTQHVNTQVAYNFDRNRCAAARKAAKVIKLKTQKGSERSKGRQHPTFEETERQAESVKRLIGPERSHHGSLIGQTPYPMSRLMPKKSKKAKKAKKEKKAVIKAAVKAAKKAAKKAFKQGGNVKSKKRRRSEKIDCETDS